MKVMTKRSMQTCNMDERDSLRNRLTLLQSSGPKNSYKSRSGRRMRFISLTLCRRVNEEEASQEATCLEEAGKG